MRFSKYVITSLFFLPIWGCALSTDEPIAGEEKEVSTTLTGTEHESEAQLDIHQRAGLDTFADASKGIALPLRSPQNAKGDNFPVAAAGTTTTEVFAIDNFLTVPISVYNSFTLQGTPSVALPPSIPLLTEQVFSVTVPAAQTWSQVMSYTTNLSSPVGDAKACSWVLTVSLNGSCTGNVSAAPLGLQGAVCGFDASRSFIDPATCQTQVVWTLR